MGKNELMFHIMNSDLTPMAKLRMAVYMKDIEATFRAMSTLIEKGAKEADVREYAEALASFDKIAGVNASDEKALIEIKLLPAMLAVEKAMKEAA